MISIITPVYNGVRFIEACVQAVIDQCCTEAEHIIVDGGSTDGTVEVIKRYALQYPHLRWVSEKDRGQSDAMNKGLALARGELIGFLNVDDYYQPDVLNRVIKIFKTLPVPSLLVGNCYVWDEHGHLLYINRPKKLKFTDLLLGPDANPFPMNPSAYFYHKALHVAIGPYSVDEHYALDLDFLLRAVRAAKVTYIDEVWGNYRMLQNTKSVADAQGRQDVRRRERIFETYRASLPPWQRWRVAIGYSFHRHVWSPIKYFSKRPQEISWRLKRRFTDVIRRR